MNKVILKRTTKIDGEFVKADGQEIQVNDEVYKRLKKSGNIVEKDNAKTISNELEDLKVKSEKVAEEKEALSNELEDLKVKSEKVAEEKEALSNELEYLRGRIKGVMQGEKVLPQKVKDLVKELSNEQE